LGAADSRIPVFAPKPPPPTKPLARLSRPLATLSNKVRAHLSSDSGAKHRQLFGGILGAGKSSKAKFLQPASRSCPDQRPARPTGFFEALDDSKESVSLTEVNKAPSRPTREHLGRRVCVGQKGGVLRYVGKIELDPGTWCGVELDAPVGLNDGSVRGVRYFTCAPLHGVLVPAGKVGLLQDEFVSEVSESGPHSLLPVKRHSMGEVSERSASQASTPTPGSTASAALIWDWTIGSQHSSSASSLVPRALPELSKHSSFEFDDSLGILTPDQMTDFSSAHIASTEDVPFLLEFDKENDRQREECLDMQFEEASVPTNAQTPHPPTKNITFRTKSIDVEIKRQEDVVMRELEDVKDEPVKFEPMEQEMIKDISEDTEMSDSNPSKKTPAMSTSYEPGSETVSNSENLEFVRINRTPSLEDLPMDKIEYKPDQVSAGPSKQVVPPPTSFVTSVTSIASLDNGYQGDGEWSRPASRGADHSPLASKVKTMDPMTDSDFFTESDADMHEEGGGQAGSGTGRGDRRAQVIDGTLYGGVSGVAQNPDNSSNYVSNQRNQRCPAFTPNAEDMDSSGIYSDLERKPHEEVDGGKSLPDEDVDETNENEKDTPEGSTRTGSSMQSDATLISPAAFTTLLTERVASAENDENMDARQRPISLYAMEDDVFLNNSANSENTDVLSEKTVVEVKDVANKKRDDLAVKKYKMPKRNVVSKIKTMITCSPVAKKEVDDENQENRRPRTQRKNGRWDAVMNKIAQNKEEEKSKPSRLKEVKSKVFAGMTLQPPQGPGQGVATTRERQLSAQSASTRSLRDVSSLKSKSRRSRTRGSECSLPAGKSPVSQASSRNSSLSDVSLTKVSPQSLRGSKKRDGVRSSSPQSDGSAHRVQTLPSRLLPTQREVNGSAVSDLKGSPVRKPTQRRSIATSTPAKPPLRDVNRVSSGKEVVTRAPQPHLELASRELRHAAQGVQALGVLLNYLVYNLDAFSTPQLKKDLDKMRADWLSTKLQMEEVTVSYRRSEEEKAACEARLRAELQRLADTHSKHVLSLTTSNEEKVKEIECRLTNQLEQVQKEHAQELQRIREDQKVELQSVKSAAEERERQLTEQLSVRAAQQLAEREKELLERLAVVQAECEHAKEQSGKLLDTLTGDKDAKLQVTAGRCKLLESEVTSLRAVLELRSSELQELRRTSELAQRDALQLPVAQQRVTALTARVEDLELQLERKIAAEQALAAEKTSMELKVQQEDHKNKRLSQYNEELMWKLKQSSEVVTQLALLTQEPSTRNSHLMTPHSQRHCHAESHQRNGVNTANNCESPPQSPKVKGVVEKSDSVSWVLDLDDTPANIACRLVRRAHSMRAVQSATPSPAHQCRTLPHKRQRSRTTPCSHRTRSFSFDSDSSEVPVPRKVSAEWQGDYSPSRDSPSPPSGDGQLDDNEDLIVVETIGEDRLGFLDLDKDIDREKIEVMGGEDFASPKLSSSSGGSEVSIHSRKNEPKAIESEEILMINRVDGLISSMPKESAGEAMISEETSDNDSGSRDSDEEVERYCSDEDSLSGSASELVERRIKFLDERKIKIGDFKPQQLTTNTLNKLVQITDSGSLQVSTTAMDLSWSEDIDLVPSETEG